MSPAPPGAASGLRRLARGAACALMLPLAGLKSLCSLRVFPRLGGCQKIKTAHAEARRRKGMQSGCSFFSLRPLRALRLCVNPFFPSRILSQPLAPWAIPPCGTARSAGFWATSGLLLAPYGEEPLTRPAPAGENAGRGPPSPHGRGLVSQSRPAVRSQRCGICPASWERAGLSLAAALTLLAHSR